MKTALYFAKQCIGDVLSKGDYAIDATIGNGHDTQFLAEQVGSSGRVYGFDVQAQAIAATQARLAEAGVESQTTLMHAGHEQASALLPKSIGARVKGVMFNLGYLPHGDKTVITHPTTTIDAIKQLLPFLASGGRMTLVIYEGHQGGREEGEAVNTYVRGLDQRVFQVVAYHMMNQKNTPPRLVVIEKR